MILSRFIVTRIVNDTCDSPLTRFFFVSKGESSFVFDEAPTATGVSSSQVTNLTTEAGYQYPWLGAATSTTLAGCV